MVRSPYVRVVAGGQLLWGQVAPSGPLPGEALHLVGVGYVGVVEEFVAASGADHDGGEPDSGVSGSETVIRDPRISRLTYEDRPASGSGSRSRFEAT